MTPMQIEILKRIAERERKYAEDNGYFEKWTRSSSLASLRSLAAERVEEVEALEAAVETAELFHLGEGVGTL